jgi:hypothetical protein
MPGKNLPFRQFSLAAVSFVSRTGICACEFMRTRVDRADKTILAVQKAARTIPITFSDCPGSPVLGHFQKPAIATQKLKDCDILHRMKSV